MVYGLAGAKLIGKMARLKNCQLVEWFRVRNPHMASPPRLRRPTKVIGEMLHAGCEGWFGYPAA